MTSYMNTIKRIIVAISSVLVCIGSCAACPDFHFADSAFGAVEQDHNSALLYLWSGDKSSNHGVAFLIDEQASYYLTARHVVAQSIKNSSLQIHGVDYGGHKMLLHVVAENETFDVALLKSDRSLQGDRVLAYELFLGNMAPELVTFAGMAFDDAAHVKPHPPGGSRFSEGGNGTLELTVNTDEGDSGAPVYTNKGLVIGIVTNKKVISQATAVAVKHLSAFLIPHAINLSLDGPVRDLHEFLLLNPEADALVDRLSPAHTPGRVSNFQLLGTINLILAHGEFYLLPLDLVHCPLSQAAFDRGLEDAATDLRVAEANLEATINTAASGFPSPTQGLDPSREVDLDLREGAVLPRGAVQLKPVPERWVNQRPMLRGLQYFAHKGRIVIVDPTNMIIKAISAKRASDDRMVDPDHAEAVGDLLLAQAYEAEQDGDKAFSRALSRKAESSFRVAIAARLKTDKRPLIVYAEAEKNDFRPVDTTYVAREILSRLGIEADVKLGRIDQTVNFSDPKQDDKFAALLDKYYEASIGALGWRPLKAFSVLRGARQSDAATAARNTAAAWATLLASSNEGKAKSWSFLGDAMLKAGQPKGAARSLAGAYRVEPKGDIQYYEIMDSYLEAKKQQSTIEGWGRIGNLWAGSTWNEAKTVEAINRELFRPRRTLQILVLKSVRFCEPYQIETKTGRNARWACLESLLYPGYVRREITASLVSRQLVELWRSGHSFQGVAFLGRLGVPSQRDGPTGRETERRGFSLLSVDRCPATLRVIAPRQDEAPAEWIE